MKHQSLFTTLERWTLSLGLAACASLSAVATAAEPAARVTEAELDRYGVPVKVVRARTPGKRAVTFEADPEPLAAGSVAVVRIESLNRGGTVQRWRCVAVDDIAECLGRPVRVPYLTGDKAVVLSVELAPDQGPGAGLELARR
jgi:hypothetical protein